MYFVPTLYYLWSRDALSRRRFRKRDYQRNSSAQPVKKDEQDSSGHHQAMERSQKLKRHYALERRLLP